MTKHCRRGKIAVLLIAVIALFFSGCAQQQTCHKAVYQDGKLLGEWDLSRSPKEFRTSDGRRIIVEVAPGIPLDTVWVSGGAAVVTVVNNKVIVVNNK